MKSEQIQQITSKAIEQLAAALDAGRNETLRQYLSAIGRFHRYSLHNVMLIAFQMPTATHVAAFQTWHKVGPLVKKGEKGILILAPVIQRKAADEEQAEPDQPSAAVGLRAAHVFDISQTEGQELSEIGKVHGETHGYRERLLKFAAEKGITVEYCQDIAPARGISEGGKITLLPRMSPAKEFATLAHELAHETLHRTERRSCLSKRMRETEAEAVAFVICSGIGLESGSASQDYIQLYEGDSKLPMESLRHVQQAANQIFVGIGAANEFLPASTCGCAEFVPRCSQIGASRNREDGSTHSPAYG